MKSYYLYSLNNTGDISREIYVVAENKQVATNIAKSILKEHVYLDSNSYAVDCHLLRVANDNHGYIDVSCDNFKAELSSRKLDKYPFKIYQTREEKINSFLE